MASKTTRKRKPWVVETNIAATGGWYEIGRYPAEDEAESRVALLQKRKHPTPLRVRRDDA